MRLSSYRPLLVPIAALAIVASAGCRSQAPADKVDDERMRAYVAQLEAIRDTLANVDDAASAKAAAPRLAALRLRMKTIRAEMGKLSEASHRDVSVRYGEAIASLTRAIIEQSRRIASDPMLAREFDDSLSTVPPLSPPSTPSQKSGA